MCIYDVCIVQFRRIFFESQRKVKEVDLYSAFIVVPHTQGAQVRITQFLPANYNVSASTS